MTIIENPTFEELGLGQTALGALRHVFSGAALFDRAEIVDSDGRTWTATLRPGTVDSNVTVFLDTVWMTYEDQVVVVFESDL